MAIREWEWLRGVRWSVTSVALVALRALGAGAQEPSFTTTNEELAARRDALAARVDSGVVLAFGARRPVHDYGQFFQLPSFRYLTNSDDADAAFVMVVRGGRGTSQLFLTPQDARRALYDGVRADSATSLARYGIAGRDFGALRGVLDSLAKAGLPFYHIPDVETTDFASLDTLTRGQETIKALIAAHPTLTVKNAMPLVLRLRAKKSATELALIRQAAAISAEGHRAAMLTANPLHEYELRAALEFEFTRRGAERPAYGSIVGSGVNGTQLHYMKASDPVRPGDLVVMDAAAEFRGYAADITRTIPVNGTYTAEQKQIYQLVRDAQDIAERMSKPGMKIRAATDSSVAVRARGLAALGLTQGVDATFDPPWKVDCTAQPAWCRQSMLWMVHGISHGIGLAVHDPLQGSGADGTFAEGDAFTIEPGIYISTRTLSMLPDTPKNRAFVAAVRERVKQYENTGVRIEDDYVITEKGLEWISRVPREIPEIEALMKRRVRVQP
ncbi:MAG: aminopeptidase P N-terminal domain-containing protein [Gemmatimonadaceae bacterium]|jgi:Xaa-Pro aminopeptidase|nr:aminopeptidase P N-terminal domain-containing protein [Gemmatimonadaceae bacterium]